jgi:hypothetical protein
MSNSAPPTNDQGERPRGTLALVALYGVLFAAGWFAVYVFIYLARGPVTQ